MAFGFSPKYVEVLDTSELTQNQAHAKALETIKKLGWGISYRKLLEDLNIAPTTSNA